ncbi:MAG TPA: phosphoenolpyruvate--protein phosphotransferase [Verrucomicrobiae bacterium]|nr:phosphoenolpyruvate--protein phosphotransferase [Verrucomicrobiae bacterium]
MEETGEKLGLRTLEDISALILHSHDLRETLDNIVQLVARRMRSDVCSLYLLDDDGKTLRLQATKGLSRSSVGKVTMQTSEGLTGLVVEQRGVVNLDDAPSHPRYKYFPETREERFHSFLGIPLLDGSKAIGVIVIQTKEERVFTRDEISTLSTIAWQIGSIVRNASLLDSVRRKEEERAFFEQELRRLKQSPQAAGRKKGKGSGSFVGTAVSAGFAWGKIYILGGRNGRSSMAVEEFRSAEEEKGRLQMALEKAKIQTLYMEKRIAERLSAEDAAIFHSHLMILEDRSFIAKIHELIDQEHPAPRAVREVVEQYLQAFTAMEDPYLRERGADMEDIGRRIIDCLEGNDRPRARLREKRIIAAEDILPSDLASMDPDRILAIVTERGNVNSHAAIMARSLGIPAVLGVEGLLKMLGVRDEVIVDGNSGHVYINPDAKIRTEYERLRLDFGVKRKELEELRDLPAETSDGFRVILRANIGLLSDIKVALANGAEGVGLYRTEFPYMARSTFPSRSEQFALYRRIVEGFPGQPVNIRTLDIGGDKSLPYFPAPREDNPFMGWRSIRISLDRRDIFRDQLAAVLMASAYGRATVMFPMISGVDEVREVSAILAEVREELEAAGHPFDRELRVGMMVELPAAVQTAEILIRRVDYFSIGTNDLIQYTLAADRNNAKVKKYFDPYHPAVLHSIKKVADAARGAGKSVSLCGEMASTPLNALLLLGMGIGEFSLSAPSIPVVKQGLRKVSLERAQQVAAEALAMESAEEIRTHLEEVRRELEL